MYLFIDTTQNFCALGLIHNKKVICFIKKQTHNNMTDVVVEQIDSLLNKNKIKHNQIKGIYLLLGPGSFTGCRVGYVITCLWNKLRSIPIYSMNSLLFQLPNGNGISIIDAKSQKKYLAIYKNFKSLVKPMIIKNTDLNKYLKKYKKFQVFEDYKSINYKKNLSVNLNKFKLSKSYNSIKPLYLKNPVTND